MEKNIGITIIFSSFIVYIFSFIFIFYFMLSFLKKKTKNLGIFMISGASMKQVQKMVFRENMLIAIVAIITSIGLGLVISPLFLMGVKNVLKADSFGMYIPIKAIIITIVLFIILYSILSKITTRFIKKGKAIQLLKADETPEKVIPYAPYKLLISIAFTALLLISIKMRFDIVEKLGLVFYIFLFISFLSTMYFVLTQAMILTTSLQNVYFVVSDEVYDSLNLRENQVFAYELSNWTERLSLIEKIEEKVSTIPDEKLVASKVSLYDTEKFVKSISFLIGFMLSLIFLSAAMSILYFYLQTSFVCFYFIIYSITKPTKYDFANLFQMTFIGITIFCLLFILSFLIIRRVYVKKLVS